MNRSIPMLCLLLLSAFALQGLDYHRDVQRSFPQRADRNRPGGRTLVYTEWAPYDIMSNFMGYWIDRPLLQDTSLRSRPDGFATGYARELSYLKRYEIDGFASLDYPEIYRNHLAVEAKHQTPGDPLRTTHLLVVAGYDYPANYQRIKDTVLTAIRAENTSRINGKAVFFIYYPPSVQAVGELRKKLKAEPEIGDSFLLLCDMPFSEFHGGFARYVNMGVPPSKAFLERYRAAVREALSVADGLILRSHDITSSGYENLWEAVVLPSYRNFMLPIILDELKQEGNQEKLIAAYVFRSYSNHLSGNNVAEYGTRQMRLYMNELLRANPDLLVLFEWNEANENTNFQPTVANGWSNLRLVRYYMRKMNGQPLEPLPGDDLAIPNLIFSCRQQAKLGELINYEILNIPDGEQSTGLIRAQLILRDADGAVLHTFPEEMFDPNELTAISYRVATEELSRTPVIVPELKVTNVQGLERTFTGFDYTRLNATGNTRYKDTFQPLRDLIEPLDVKFEVTANPDGATYQADAFLKAPEKLHALEIVNAHEEVAAADPSNKFDTGKYLLIRGSFTAMDTVPRLLKITGTFRITGTNDWRLHSDQLAHNHIKVTDKKGNSAKVYAYFHWMPQNFALLVPHGDAPNVRLEIDYPDGVGKHSFAISELLKHGSVAKNLNRNIRLDLALSDRLTDNPAPLAGESAAIHTRLNSAVLFPTFQLRAIGASGKTYRSKPIVPKRCGGDREKMPVFSEFSGKVVEADVAKSAIPDLNYRFDPARGAMLASGYSPEFDAQLGGGFVYLNPMWKKPLEFIDPNYRSFAPAWQGNVLDFDGVSNYISFPRETMPRGAYRIDFTIRTPGNRDQVLLRCFSYDACGTLQLLLNRDNELIASSAIGEWNQPFATGLHVTPGKWSDIGVRYDLAMITFTVDGKSKSFPFAGRGNRFKPAAFGGTNQPFGPVKEGVNYFLGQLKSFHIKHNAQ